MAQAAPPIQRQGQATARPAWARVEHPVYRLERGRRAASPVLRLLQSGCLPLILAAAGLAAVGVAALTIPRQAMWSLEGAAMGTLGGLLFAFVLIQLIAGAASNILVVAQTAPLISSEIELQSWGLLRTTTLPLREIVLAKYTAALSLLRTSLTGLVILRAASTITGLLFLAYTLLRQTFYHDPLALEMWIERRMWIMPVVAGVLFAVWYTSQPVVQFLLNGALGLLASTFSPTQGRAVAVALAGRLVGWVASITLNVGLIYGLVFLLIQNWADPRSAPLEAFRSLSAPAPERIAFVLGLVAALYVLVVILLQLGFIVGALALAERRAGRLGG